MPFGYLSLILNAHLPFVRHPEHPSFLEERWLFEAITEAYLPLLVNLSKLTPLESTVRLTLSVSPPLLAMLRDPCLQERYVSHLSSLVLLAQSEVRRTSSERSLHALALMYERFFADALELFENRFQRDLIGALKVFQELGMLEIITSAATHGYLPLLKTNACAVRAQIMIGQESYIHAFGQPARGFWLPECGYYPGLEEMVAEAGFRYVIVESHAVTNASSRPRYGTLAPMACPNGLATFARDPRASEQVWSAECGYPGDFYYRDYYRDLGFDAELEYIRPYVPEKETRISTGIKYHRITGKHNQKELYEPAKAQERAKEHAEHFLDRRIREICGSAGPMDRPPLVVCPYDAELFGHWWFEGPLFLYHLLKRSAARPEEITLVTPSEYLHRHPALQRATPSASSWGWQGYNEFWLSDCNEWIYPHLHRASEQMEALAVAFDYVSKGSLAERALNQAARSLLISQASDWAFIMKTGTAVEYARRRVLTQLSRFNYLISSVQQHDINEEKLTAFERMDNIFPFLDFRVFSGSYRIRTSATLAS